MKYFLQFHGLKNTIKLIFYRRYKTFKQSKLDLTKDRIVSVNGYDFQIMPHDKGISAELLMFHVHEPLTTKLILQSLKKGMICIDIGSNIGYYAILESRVVGEEGKVIAIEPSPANFTYLKKNIDLQTISNIESYNIALSNNSGYINFLVDHKSNLSRVVENIETSSGGEIIKVPAETLDSFLQNKSIGRLDFLRMDVEGHEFEIFQGMHETIRKFKPLIIMEFHKSVLGKEKAKKLLYEIKNDGYKLHYYVDRALDEPIMAKEEFIQEMDLEELSTRLERNMVPSNFTLLFQS